MNQVCVKNSYHYIWWDPSIRNVPLKILAAIKCTSGKTNFFKGYIKENSL